MNTTHLDGAVRFIGDRPLDGWMTRQEQRLTRVERRLDEQHEHKP